MPFPKEFSRLINRRQESKIWCLQQHLKGNYLCTSFFGRTIIQNIVVQTHLSSKQRRNWWPLAFSRWGRFDRLSWNWSFLWKIKIEQQAKEQTTFCWHFVERPKYWYNMTKIINKKKQATNVMCCSEMQHNIKYLLYYTSAYTNLPFNKKPITTTLQYNIIWYYLQ